MNKEANSFGCEKKQTGAALMLMLLLIVLGGVGVLVGALDRFKPVVERDKTTSDALAQAKAALIGYAMTYPENHTKGVPPRVAFVPGHLPCPDADGAIGTAGDEDPNCGAKGVTVVGYLPWRTLGLPPLRDGWGNCLWYGISGSFKANPKPDLLNWDSLGQFKIVDANGNTVVGGDAPSRPVAVIFSPGPPVGGQNRTNANGECGGDYDPAHFLDASASVNNYSLNAAADEISTVAEAGPEATFNDRLLWISRDDVLARGIQKRSDLITRVQKLQTEVAKCVARYGQSNAGKLLPWAAQISLPDASPDTFKNDKFDDTPGLLVGRIPFLIRDSFNATGSSLPTFSGCSGTSADCRLFRADNCASSFLAMAGYPTPTDSAVKDSPDGWFEKWKDHLFYAVAEDFKPSSPPPAALCDAPTTAGRKCLYVDGTGPYAAVVIFAGNALPSQSRTDVGKQNSVANYLEGINATAISTTDSSDPRFGLFSKAIDTSHNDRVVCIKTDLSIDENCTNP